MSISAERQIHHPRSAFNPLEPDGTSFFSADTAFAVRWHRVRMDCAGEIHQSPKRVAYHALLRWIGIEQRM